MMPYRNRPLAKRHPALADQLFSSIEWRSPPERLSPPAWTCTVMDDGVELKQLTVGVE